MKKMYDSDNLIKNVLSVFFLIIVFISCNTSSVLKTQDATEYVIYDSLTHQKVYSVVDEMPVYPGGEEALFMDFIKNFKYPESQKEFQSKIVMEYIVDEQGKVTGQRIRNKNPEEITAAEKEALRVLGLLQQWTPGRLNGKNVSVLMGFPLHLDPER